MSVYRTILSWIRMKCVCGVNVQVQDRWLCDANNERMDAEGHWHWRWQAITRSGLIIVRVNCYTHTHLFNSLLFRTTRVGWYQKKHSPTHTHTNHRTSLINMLHLLRSIASSLFSLRAWQSFSTTSVQVLFGLPLGFGPSNTIAACFAAILMLCHLYLVSPYLEICLLAYHHTSTWPFSSLLA